MAELADALVLEASGNPVRVRVPLLALFYIFKKVFEILVTSWQNPSEVFPLKTREKEYYESSSRRNYPS